MLHKYTKSTALTLALLCAIFTGCVTDNTPSAAADARKYALKNIRGIPEDARHYIRYTKPVVYENVIFPNTVMPAGDQDHIKVVKLSELPFNEAHDLMHSCFVWTPPGLGAMIVVAGSGERSMQFWKPSRALVKNYTAPDAAFTSAMAKASQFAYDSLNNLSTAELNRIRFRAPDVRYTNFNIKFEAPSSKTPQEEVDPRLAPETPKEILPPVQISLVWPADTDKNFIAVTGFAVNGRFATWNPVEGQTLSAAALAKNTLSADETEKLNLIQYDPAKLIFPPKAKIDRGNTEIEKDSLFGPSIRMR